MNINNIIGRIQVGAIIGFMMGFIVYLGAHVALALCKDVEIIPIIPINPNTFGLVAFMISFIVSYLTEEGTL